MIANAVSCKNLILSPHDRAVDLKNLACSLVSRYSLAQPNQIWVKHYNMHKKTSLLIWIGCFNIAIRIPTVPMGTPHSASEGSNFRQIVMIQRCFFSFHMVNWIWLLVNSKELQMSPPLVAGQPPPKLTKPAMDMPLPQATYAVITSIILSNLVIVIWISLKG